MNKTTSTATTLTIDLKKYRIRIFKQALHLMGDPKYLQLLVNPNGMEVAILAVEKEMSGDQTHKVNLATLRSDNCIEIYSAPFVKKLCAVVGGLENIGTYRLSGEVIMNKKAAVFSLKTIKRLEAPESHNG